MKLVTNKFKSGGLHEKHVLATCYLGNHLSICLYTQGNQEKPVSRWPVAGPSEYWLLASSPASKVKTAIHTQNTTNTYKMTTIHTIQLQQYTQDILKYLIAMVNVNLNIKINFCASLAHEPQSIRHNQYSEWSPSVSEFVHRTWQMSNSPVGHEASTQQACQAYGWAPKRHTEW